MYLWDKQLIRSVCSDCFFQAFKFTVICINRKEFYFMESKSALSPQINEIFLRGTDENA